MDIQKIIRNARKSVLDMPGYSSARSLYKAADGYIFLDANECPYEPYIGAVGGNRYPSQQPDESVSALCRLYDVSSRHLVLTRGADEAIDILIRCFCESGQDSILICPPTFPMYVQAAALQGAAVRTVPLLMDKEFALDIAGIKDALSFQPKIIFLCSPNNPTGNILYSSDIEEVCQMAGDVSLVVVDETYIEFSGQESSSRLIEKYPNLVVLRTLSKAYAAAGLRAGVAIAHSEIIALLKKILAPYPVSQPVAAEVSKILTDKNISRLKKLRQETLLRRDRVVQRLREMKDVEKIFPSDANFLLVRVKDAHDFCARCLDGGVVVRNQSHQLGLENCVRISIGSDEDMEAMFSALSGVKADAKLCRVGRVTRKTSETAIDVIVNLDAKGPIKVSTGIGFYDHMLEQIAKHGGFSIVLECVGDLEIDPHHTVEDCAIALGGAIKQALGDKRGIDRYGFTVPMDESLCDVAIDLSGRYFLSFTGQFPDRMVGDLPTDMVEHIFRSVAENLQATCHIMVTGENSHHMVEACFKAFGRALGLAIQSHGNDLPSTKGVL